MVILTVFVSEMVSSKNTRKFIEIVHVFLGPMFSHDLHLFQELLHEVVLIDAVAELPKLLTVDVILSHSPVQNSFYLLELAFYVDIFVRGFDRVFDVVASQYDHENRDIVDSE